MIASVAKTTAKFPNVFIVNLLEEGKKGVSSANFEAFSVPNVVGQAASFRFVLKFGKNLPEFRSYKGSSNVSSKI